MKRLLMRCFTMGVLVIGAASVVPAYASIVLNNTRVVLEERSQEVSVKMTNNGDKPVIVQSWIDDGDVKKDPSQVRVPFILMPPIARVDPAKGQTLRLMYTGEKLPKDRESVFYLNVLEIPPKVAPTAGENVVQIALRTRIKLFFRPKSLKGSSIDAPKQLLWVLVKKGTAWALQCTNQSSYHVSLSEVSLSSGSASSKVGDGMVTPGGKLEIPLVSVLRGATGVKFQAIDDFGAGREHVAPLTR